MPRRSTRIGSVAVVDRVVSLLLPAGAAAADGDCADAIWETAPADLPLAEGWSWESYAPYALGALGALGGNVDVSDEDDGVLWFAAYCSPHAEAHPGAETAFIGHIMPALPESALPLGDAVSAYRESGASGNTMLVWYRDDVVARVPAPAEAHWAAVQDFAAALDEMLP